MWTVLAMALVSGGSSAINHWYDRDIDALMERTSARPVASGRVPPVAALAFGVALAAIGVAALAIEVNWLAAFWAFAGFVCYVFVYTVWLKRRTPQNIVIGGAAGAVPPLVAWAAVTGSVSATAVALFAIVFLWTPPHFWALALLLDEDYARAGVPMLPTVRGARASAHQILVYTLLLVDASLVPVALGTLGWFYAIAAVLLGGRFIWLAVRSCARPTTARPHAARSSTRCSTSPCCSSPSASTRVLARTARAQAARRSSTVTMLEASSRIETGVTAASSPNSGSRLE